MYEIRITTETHPIHLQTALNSHNFSNNYETFDYKKIDDIVSAEEARKLCDKVKMETYFSKFKKAIDNGKRFVHVEPLSDDLECLYRNNPRFISSSCIIDQNITKKDIHPDSILNQFMDKGYTITFSYTLEEGTYFTIHW